VSSRFSAVSYEDFIVAQHATLLNKVLS